MSTPTLRTRDVPPRAAFALEQAGVHPLLARLFAARGVRSGDELDNGLARLLPPSSLRGAEAAVLLADAIAAGQRLCIVADYDCDGATACAVALRGLVMLGAAPANVGYVVPDRAVHGYGLTPAIVDLALQQFAAGPPAVLVTVDNGIASIAGVAHARALGLQVLVTDHHLPALGADGAVELPAANVIVNPSQPDCNFESKALAGVGVMFYVLLALRAEQRQRGLFEAAAQPRLDALLDLVALGTVADVVRLDANNRRLVAQGLKRVRSGRMQPGVAALFAVAGRANERAAGFDFGFALGPRINAAGRLSDMTLGIECLSTDDPSRALELAQQLDAINRERRVVEADMRLQAELLLEQLLARQAGCTNAGDFIRSMRAASASSVDVSSAACIGSEISNASSASIIIVTAASESPPMAKKLSDFEILGSRSVVFQIASSSRSVAVSVSSVEAPDPARSTLASARIATRSVFPFGVIGSVS